MSGKVTSEVNFYLKFHVIFQVSNYDQHRSLDFTYTKKLFKHILTKELYGENRAKKLPLQVVQYPLLMCFRLFKMIYFEG